MGTLAEFKPLIPEQKQEMLEYYKNNNIPVPDNQYFKDYFSIKPEEIEAVRSTSEPQQDSKSWDFSDYDVAEILKKAKSTTGAKITDTPQSTFTGGSNEFFTKFKDAAQKASQKTGIPAQTLLAISALETGYGKSMPGNMVAGIKADYRYRGPSQELSTTEVVDGKSIKTKAKFRAYDTPEQAFEDFGNFFKENPRYRAALNQGDPYKSAQEIAKAGYATDPNYYSKLKSIIDSMS